MGADYKSLRGGAHKGEGITGHQGQNGVGRAVQDFDVLGGYHLDKIHAIAKGSIQSFQGDFIILMDIAQGPEECVPMSSEGHISRLTGERGPRDVSDRAPQSLLVNTFQDHG